jgi:cytochrome P450
MRIAKSPGFRVDGSRFDLSQCDRADVSTPEGDCTMTTDMTTDLLDVARIDDPNFYIGDPHPVYRRLPEEAPVWWYEPAGVWVLSRYADICRVEREATLFSIARGGFMGEISTAPPPGAPLPMYTLGTDPPYHSRFKKLLSAPFTPDATAKREAAVRQLAIDAIEQLPADGRFDFTSAISVPVTIGVIAQMLGVQRSDWSDFKRWSDAIVDLFEIGLPASERPRVMGEIAELDAYIADQIDWRADHPSDDILTAMSQAEIDGVPIPREAKIETCRGLLAAGNETTRNALSAGAVAIADHPDEWARIVADPSLAAGAADEILRYTSILLHFIRSATADTVIGDQPIAAGDFVVMLYASANFDESAFPDPHRFDVGRPSHPAHLAFGFGPHRCLGAALAKLEIRVVLEELAKRYPTWRSDGPPLRHPSTVVASYKSVPVALSGR